MGARPFQILSLDGGGVKGLFSAALLAQLEEDCGVSVAEHFDLITGTSTGGLIALGLGAGLRPREIVEFYLSDAPTIFADRTGLKGIRRLWAPKFSAAPLEVALKRRFGGRTLGQSVKRLIVPSYNLADDDVYLFRTPHHERLKRDYRVAMWRVAMATTAAPTYFAAYRGVDRIPLADGGLWANNPSMVAIVEAIGTLSTSPDCIRLLSLGTTQPVKRGTHLVRGGLRHWALPSTEVLLRGQGLCAINQARHLVGRERVMRLDPVVPDDAFCLDRLNVDDLLAMAAHESRKACPEFQSSFAEHVAPAYRPLHGTEPADAIRTASA
jgi:patatin-like phospholipase/acyl hydrolase